MNLLAEDAALLREVAAAESAWVRPDALQSDEVERSKVAARLRDLTIRSSSTGLKARARNLGSLLDPDPEQQFGDLEGIRTTDPAFLVPLAVAAKWRRPLPPHALELWAGDLRPGIPTVVWDEAHVELRQLAAMSCGEVSPTEASGHLVLQYTPLGRDREACDLRCPALPNVRRSPPRELRDAIARAEHDLERYAKTLAASDATTAEERIARMPKPLFELAMTRPEGQALLSRSRALLEQESSPTVADLLEITVPNVSDPGAREIVIASELLERCGVGFEPDPRYLAPIPRLDVPVQVFAWNTVSLRPRAPFVSAVALLQIGTAIAFSDGHLDLAERTQIEHELSLIAELSGEERVRLDARLEFLVREPPDADEVLRRMGALGGASRDMVAQVLVRVASSDGRVTASEQAMLTKAFKALRLPRRRLADALSELAYEVAVEHVDQPRATTERRSAIGVERDEQQYNVLRDLLLGPGAAILEP